MRKCDFCRHSHLKDGQLVCPFVACGLMESEIKEMLKDLAKINTEDKEEHEK